MVVMVFQNPKTDFVNPPPPPPHIRSRWISCNSLVIIDSVIHKTELKTVKAELDLTKMFSKLWKVAMELKSRNCQNARSGPCLHIHVREGPPPPITNISLIIYVKEKYEKDKLETNQKICLKMDFLTALWEGLRMKSQIQNLNLENGERKSKKLCDLKVKNGKPRLSLFPTDLGDLILNTL